MKTKIILAALLIMVVGVFKGNAQNHPEIDDRVLIMNEIEKLPEVPSQPMKEWWKKARNVEDCSLFFGYSSYGAPWNTPALHGAAFGISIKHLMLNFDFGLGSLIDGTAYDNENGYDYLKANSTQSFGFLSAHYYLIKYFSFGVGLGYHTELQKITSTTIETHDDYSIENDKISFKNKGFFGLRFGARAYIPLFDKFSLYLSGNYDVIPSNVRKSKLDLGIGLKISLDY